MRQFITKYGLAIAGTLFVVAIVIAYFSTGRGSVRGTPMAYYIDEETGEQSEQPADAIPPLPNKEGKLTVVRVVKFSCDKKKTAATAYYEKYSERAKQAIERKDANAPDIEVRGLLVRAPEKGSPWVSQLSSEGAQIVQRAHCENPTDLIFVGPRAR